MKNGLECLETTRLLPINTLVFCGKVNLYNCLVFSGNDVSGKNHISVRGYCKRIGCRRFKLMMPTHYLKDDHKKIFYLYRSGGKMAFF